MATAALALFAGGSTTALADTAVTSDEDITAPSISGVTITPLSVDVTDGVNKSFTVELTATDDLSGVGSVSLSYSGPSSGGLGFHPYRVSGDDKNGTYKGTTTVTPLHANGTYNFNYLTVRDVVGNYRYYSLGDQVAPPTLEVISNADAVPPVIHDVTVSPDPIDVSASAGSVTVEVDVTDDASGVSYVSGYFYSPTGRQYAYFSGSASSGTTLVRATTTIRRYSDPGDWKMSSLCAGDKAGNRHCLSEWSTPKISDVSPAAAALTVVSDPADTARPTLSAFRVSPGAIDVTAAGQPVSVEFDVSDNLSGISYAYAYFSSPRTVGASPEVMWRSAWAYAPSLHSWKQAADGTWQSFEDESKRTLGGTLTGTVWFPRYDRSGDWAITSICVVDNVNWTTCYSGDQLATKGTTTLKVEWNRTPVVTISGIDKTNYSRGQEPAPTCTATDLEDGTVVTTITKSDPAADGTVTVTCTATDSGGVTGTATKTYILDPNTAPTLEGHPTTDPDGKNGWYTSDVMIDWTAADVDGNLDLSTVPADEVISTEGRDQTRSATVSDLAGLTASATSTPAVNIDKTAPSIAFTGNAGSYRLTDTITIGCSASDALSGIAAQSCTGINGAAWQYAPGGAASASAEDVAGNTTTATSPFTVTVNAAGLCDLVKQFSDSAGITQSLCAKLHSAAAADARGDAGAAKNVRAAFVSEVAAQSGKALTAEEAAVLTRLVGLL